VLVGGKFRVDAEAGQVAHMASLMHGRSMKSTFEAKNRNHGKDEHGALEGLARTDARNLYYFILKRVGDPHEAEDLMQQAFESALRNLDSFRGDCELRTWVYGIASNLLRNHLNRSPRRLYEFDSEETLDALASQEEGPEQKTSQMDLLAKLDYCLGELPEEMRLTIMLVLVEEISCSDAARELKVPVGTIRSRISRARRILKEKLENRASGVEGRKKADTHGHARPSGRTHFKENVAMSSKDRTMAQQVPAANEGWLSDLQRIDAYRCLSKTRDMVNTELRQGKSPRIYEAWCEYLGVLDTAMNALKQGKEESIAA
jgi:RNA polymerase sigma-70 factor (ECF subfamily)